MTTARSPRRPRIARSAVATSAALSVLALGACGTDDNGGGAAGDGDGTLSVTASFYPMAFLAERVGGDHVDVTTLTSPGVDPHDLELSPRQVGALGESDAILYIAGLQPAVDDAIGQSGVEHVAEVMSFVNSAPAEDEDKDGEEDHGDDGHNHGEDDHDHADEDHGHDHGEDDHDHADEDHGHDHGDEDHDHAEDDHDGHHHDHDHGDGDPHLWLDPLTFAVAADGVADTLAEADPGNAEEYRKNAADLADELRALDEEFEAGLANRETDTIITTHAAFGYLAERYGLREEAIAGLDPESEPSGARMRELHDVAERDEVTTVFFEVLASDAMATTLAEDLGLETDVLDPVEGITDASRGDDYFAVMRANLEALQKALRTDA
ncbi:zinc ABC transporter substrate-binding protein [Streptomyces sp. ventii]|uniref:Zinc ABC transporter substrate-binding protein n=2 Tax=Streptomyces spiramenti TaxID=2720606 RepID=A0ABX1AM52_9ACTN|nr:metal ABC transporter substrate-binding protein [Streptomyces spiramenti]NJP68189.1 zinc ABC transporter substrate-binding protein [Streptomyces spiramenti]